MTDVNFCDGLDFCDVHGHTIYYEKSDVDICGNETRIETCQKCGKYRWVMVYDNGLRLSSEIYPTGEWKNK